MDMTHANPELLTALAAAHGELENASKNSKNPHFKSTYADLAEVINTVRPTLSKHGLSLLQSTAFDGAHVHVTTVLAHKSGGFVSSTASAAPAKSDSQGVGACTTYLRRYSAAAMCCIAQEDLDGNDSAHNTPPRKPAAISADRVQTIRNSLREKQIDESAFVRWLGAGSLESMTDKQAAVGEAELARRAGKGEAA